jgi:hypothetical protein
MQIFQSTRDFLDNVTCCYHFRLARLHGFVLSEVCMKLPLLLKKTRIRGSKRVSSVAVAAESIPMEDILKGWTSTKFRC